MVKGILSAFGVVWCRRVTAISNWRPLPLSFASSVMLKRVRSGRMSLARALCGPPYAPMHYVQWDLHRIPGTGTLCTVSWHHAPMPQATSNVSRSFQQWSWQRTLSGRTSCDLMKRQSNKICAFHSCYWTLQHVPARQTFVLFPTGRFHRVCS